MGGCLAYHETRLFKKLSQAGCLELGAPQTTQSFVFFHAGAPFIAAHSSAGPTGTLRSGHVPTFLLLRWRQKSKIETPDGPGNNLTCESRAQTWFQVLGKDCACPLWRWWSPEWGQCAHWRWRKAIVGTAHRASCQVSVWGVQLLSKVAGRQLLFNRVVQPSTVMIQRWRHGEQWGGWEGVIAEAVFSTTSSPTGRFPKMGSVVWKNLTLCPTHFWNVLFQRICYWTLLGGVGLIWDECSCFSNTFEATCCSHRGTSPGTLLFSTNLFTNYWCPQNSLVTWGGFPWHWGNIWVSEYMGL